MSSKTVLFVCTVNRNRSVVAEYLLRGLLRARNDAVGQEVDVVSAGLGYSPDEVKLLEADGKFWDKPVFGLPPYPYLVESMKRRGLDISESRSKGITAAMAEKADLIIVFTNYQKEKILSLYPLTNGKVFAIQEFVGYTGYLVGRDHSISGWFLDDETKGWTFPDAYLEGSTTEIEHMLWWGMNKFIEFLTYRGPT